MGVSNFTSETPTALLLSEDAKAFLKVLDEVLAEKRLHMSEQETVLNPITNASLKMLKLLFRECTGFEVFQTLPKRVFENVIMNARNLYAFKGSKEGFRLLAKCFCDGDMFFKDSNLFPDRYIILSSFHNGYLPSGTDLGLHPDNDNLPGLLYLYGGDLAEYYGSVKIYVVSPYFNNESFRKWFAEMLPDFIPMVDRKSSDISIYMYAHDYVGVPYTYNLNLE